jgi:tripartite-type tricarboxylate transporter receptor subunit TctC
VVVRTAPEGYTLLLAVTPNAIDATPYEKLNFNFIRDIAPVAGIVRAPKIMVVNPFFSPRQSVSSSLVPRPTRERSTWPRRA